MKMTMILDPPVSLPDAMSCLENCFMSLQNYPKLTCQTLSSNGIE